MHQSGVPGPRPVAARRRQPLGLLQQLRRAAAQRAAAAGAAPASAAALAGHLPAQRPPALTPTLWSAPANGAPQRARWHEGGSKKVEVARRPGRLAGLGRPRLVPPPPCPRPPPAPAGVSAPVPTPARCFRATLQADTASVCHTAHPKKKAPCHGKGPSGTSLATFARTRSGRTPASHGQHRPPARTRAYMTRMRSWRPSSC